MARPKRPSDPNQLAKFIVDSATGTPDAELRSQMAKLLGRQGGLSGGPARAAALSPRRRTEIAKAAAAKRWADKPKKRP